MHVSSVISLHRARYISYPVHKYWDKSHYIKQANCSFL